MTKLHAYQEYAVDFIHDRLNQTGVAGAGLFADMGLGKTLITLELIKRLAPKRTLIIAPKRVKEMVWPTEHRKHGYHKHFELGPFRGTHDVELVTCDSLHKLVDDVGRWQLVVVDESTKLKNVSTRRFRAMRRLLKGTPKRLILTGTPTPNSMIDLWAQMYIVDNGKRLGKTLTYFRAQHCEKGGYMGREWRLRQNQERAIYAKVNDAVLRMDALDHLDMPELIVNDIVCPMPTSARQVHQEMKHKLATLLEGEPLTAPNAAAAAIKCRQVANGFMYDEDGQSVHLHNSKFEALDEILESIQGAQAVISYQFRRDGSELAKKGAATFDSRASTTIIDRWLAGKPQLLALQEQSGSHGLNLQGGGCGTMVCFGLSYSGEAYKQMVARLYRQGGARRVIVHRLLAEDSIDMVIRDKLDGKVKSQDEFLAALKTWAKS